MSKSSMSDKALFNAANVIRSYGLGDQSSMIDLLYRVVLTKKVLSSKDGDCDTVLSHYARSICYAPSLSWRCRSVLHYLQCSFSAGRARHSFPVSYTHLTLPTN